MLGLYLHVPFCSAICNYCNFNRGLYDAALAARYVDALAAEIDRASPDRAPSARADTIYFGGGTPSLLEPPAIGRIIAACRARFDLAADCEVTLEANPETVDRARLAGFREAGVNRLSLGVQSFRDDELRRLSRLHGAERAGAAVREARDAGFDNISLDLMMWLPGQRVDHWLESIDRAIATAPEHLSLYLLEVYPNAPLREAMARAAWSQAPDDDAAAMYLTAMERLELAGYEQYEISNVARPGRRCRHNLKYWSDGEWLGFGCGAHATRGGVRTRNVAGTEEYLALVEAGVSAVAETLRQSADERLGDALFMGLRLADGIDLSAIGRRYGTDVRARFGDALGPFLSEGILGTDGIRLWLTRRGMLIANEVMTVFV
jgi:oxygen-independent coproporphyrinogen-3 oxidase